MPAQRNPSYRTATRERIDSSRVPTAALQIQVDRADYGRQLSRTLHGGPVDSTPPAPPRIAGTFAPPRAERRPGFSEPGWFGLAPGASSRVDLLPDTHRTAIGADMRCGGEACVRAQSRMLLDHFG